MPRTRPQKGLPTIVNFSEICLALSKLVELSNRQAGREAAKARDEARLAADHAESSPEHELHNQNASKHDELARWWAERQQWLVQTARAVDGFVLTLGELELQAGDSSPRYEHRE